MPVPTYIDLPTTDYDADSPITVNTATAWSQNIEAAFGGNAAAYFTLQRAAMASDNLPGLIPVYNAALSAASTVDIPLDTTTYENFLVAIRYTPTASSGYLRGLVSNDGGASFLSSGYFTIGDASSTTASGSYMQLSQAEYSHGGHPIMAFLDINAGDSDSIGILSRAISWPLNTPSFEAIFYGNANHSLGGTLANALRLYNSAGTMNGQVQAWARAGA